MPDNFAADVVQLANASVLSGTVDPSAGAGVAAPEGSLYLRFVAAAGEVWQKTTAANTGWQLVGGGGAAGPLGQSIEVVSATAPLAVLGNAVSYIPLRVAQSDTIEFQFVAAATGTVEITAAYAMSAANAGIVSLRLDRLINTDGSDPSAAITVGTPFTETPGNDVLQHTVTDAQLQLAVTVGDLVYCLLQRPVGGDTHTGDFRILQMIARML